MISCNCGRILIESVEEGFVVPTYGEKRWMRRKSDTVTCPSCGSCYALRDLKSLPMKHEPASA